MTREELFDAFREVASEEFAHIPDEKDIEYEFSKRFKKKMDKLFKKIEHNCNYPRIRFSKKLLIIAAAILIIFASLMSVSAIRKPVVSFIVKKYETFIEFFFSGDTSEQIEYKYGFSRIPEGFDLATQISEYDMEYTKYKNEKTGDEFIFKQTITDQKSLSIDNEHGTTTTVIINGIEVHIYKHENGDYIHANWIKESYSMFLAYYGNIEENDFIDLIKLIE